MPTTDIEARGRTANTSNRSGAIQNPDLSQREESVRVAREERPRQLMSEIEIARGGVGGGGGTRARGMRRADDPTIRFDGRTGERRYEDAGDEDGGCHDRVLKYLGGRGG